jgi:FkbM family methyltransferase
MFNNRKAAAELRTHLALFPKEHYGVVSYTIEDAVANDAYDLLRHVDTFMKDGSELSVLDVGANFGVFSLGVRAMCTAIIVAVEPSPTTFAALVSATEGSEIQCVNHAMGEGTQVYMVHAADPLCTTVSSAEQQTQKVYAAKLSHMIKQYDVGTTWGDENATHPFLLKIDCEGGESALLRDPRETAFLMERLHKCKGAVGLEIHWGSKYYAALGDSVREEEWDVWATNLSKHVEVTRTRLTSTTGIVSFGVY